MSEPDSQWMDGRSSSTVSEFGDPDWLRAVRGLHAALQAGGFATISRIPSERSFFALPLERRNLLGYMRKRRGLMEPTALPGIYRALNRLGDRRFDEWFAFFFLGEARSAERVETMMAGLPSAPNAK